MQIAIRADASSQIGSGHIMRCLALAEQLRMQGADVIFICRNLVDNLNDLVVQRGFDVCRLPAPADKNSALSWNQHADWLQVHWQNDADETLRYLKNRGTIDWLIVDHYALDKNWENQQRMVVEKIMVIDDLADRPHDCDLLLDQNLNKAACYKILIPKNCTKLLGPKYALLRPEFIKARNQLRQRDGTIQRIFIFFGGVDLHNLTSKIIKVIQKINISEIKIDVVIGGQNPHYEQIIALCKEMNNVQCYRKIQNISDFMSAADLAIGGAGSTIWERCFLGLPSIIFSMAKNQTKNAEEIAQCGAACYMGTEDSFDYAQFIHVFHSLLQQPDRVLQISNSAFSVMGDYQGIDAIIKKIYNNER